MRGASGKHVNINGSMICRVDHMIGLDISALSVSCGRIIIGTGRSGWLFFYYHIWNLRRSRRPTNVHHKCLQLSQYLPV